ncbi:MAG: metal ABC transporter ATP-binding protein [Opitutales bacterium]
MSTVFNHMQSDAPKRHAESLPLSVRDLTVAYHRKPVVWDIDLSIPEGKLVAVVGPNGAGKSTLLKACLELIPRASGEVTFFGQKYAKQRKRVGYVPQRESVDWDFPVSVLDVVAMGTYGELGWFRRVNKRSKALAMQALDRVDLAEYADRQISQLSGGQQQRTFLARALVQDADIYFMDEPFAAVDAATERAIVQLLKDLQGRGKTCLVVHHDLATVPQYFDWTVLLNMRVVASGPTAEVFNQENLRNTYGGKLSLLSEAAEEWMRSQ